MSDMSDSELSVPDEEASISEGAQGRSGLIVVGSGPTGRAVVHRTGQVTQTVLVDKNITSEEAAAPELEAVRVVHGDATSLLVLGEAGIAQAHVVIAATSEDAVNIEACRLAVEAGVPEVISRLTDPDKAEEVMALGGQPVTASMAMSGALTSRVPGVVETTSEVGLGEGEILQVRVMPGSLVIGHPLREITTREYLVAAIYRGGELIVPHGDTCVDAGDQVLLVGSPDTLRAIADYFRLGAAQFPRQFGSSIVLWNESGDDRFAAEAAWLSEVSKVTRLYQITEPALKRADQEVDSRFEELPLEPPPADPLGPIGEVHPAIFVLEPPSTGVFHSRSLGTLAPLLERVESPVLLARGTAPYRRILVPVTDRDTAWRELELAVDIARLVGARITALHVAQPRFLGGSRGEERAQGVVKSILEVARLYGVDVQVEVAEGNSIREAVELAADHQLVVTTRHRNQPDSYFRPDVGLRIALGVPCSAVLLSVT